VKRHRGIANERGPVRGVQAHGGAKDAIEVLMSDESTSARKTGDGLTARGTHGDGHVDLSVLPPETRGGETV
jgi:hypothetical protein